MDRCEECGFVYDLAEATASGAAIVGLVAEIASLIGSGRADLATRSESEIWSPLEYGCHVRDVLLVQRERMLLGLRADVPSFDPMGRDERVAHDGYASQGPADVARQLVDAGRLFANVLDRLGPDDWDRTVMYNHPQRFERSLRWVAVHTVHEARHHLLDIRRQRPGRSARIVVSAADYLWFVDQALDEMMAIVRRLGDERASVRPDLHGANSPYAILTHCLGVMEHWGGHMVAGRTVVRDRDAEFRATGSVAELIGRTDAARRQLAADLGEAHPSAVPRSTPDPQDADLPFGRSQGGVLMHIYEELAQHLGQMQLSRDVLLAAERSVTEVGP